MLANPSVACFRSPLIARPDWMQMCEYNLLKATNKEKNLSKAPVSVWSSYSAAFCSHRSQNWIVIVGLEGTAKPRFNNDV